MALVFPHEGPSKGVIGKFLGDGLEYLACVRDDRFIDFYLFPECYIKCKTIEMFERERIYNPKLYSMSPTLDYLVINGEPCKYWNTTELIDLEGKFYDMSFPGPNVAPGLFLNGKNQVRKENEVVFSRDPIDEAYASVSLLDEDTIAIFDKVEGEDEGQLEIFSLKSNRVLSKWTFELKFLEYRASASYVSRGDKSKVLILFAMLTFESPSEKVYVLDISQPEAQVTQYFHERERDTVQDTTLVFYDDATGAAVFHSLHINVGFYFEHILSVFGDGKFSGLYPGSAVGKYYFSGSNVYEIVVNPDKELQFEYKTSIPAMRKIEHSYRDLAGTVYLSENGVFRESLAFSTSCVLSNKSVEPVNNIFWVGNHRVLISGRENSIVVDVRATKEVDSWYKPLETLFACKSFQVYKSAHGKLSLRAKDKETELPFADVCSFASSGSSIVIGSTKKVAVISQDLETKQMIEDDSIIWVFNEGYVCKSGVKFFKTSERNIQANGIVSAQLVDDVLFTVSTNGELRSGEHQESVNLMLEGVDFLSTSGDKMLIPGTNDTYIYSKGEYVSIEAGDHDSLLVSNDKQACVSLLEGVVYLKSNVGFRMVKKKVGGMLDYGSLSVCNDKLMCSQEKTTMEDIVIVKFITKNVTHQFRMSSVFGGYQYILFSDTHFIKKYEHLGDSKVTVHQLANPEISEQSLEGENLKAITLPSVVSDNKLYVVDFSGNSTIVESVNGEVVQHLGNTEHESENDESEEDESEEDESEEYGVHKLGFTPSDYPRSGNHWIVYFKDDGKDKIHLIPKSQESIIREEYQGYMHDPPCDWISAIPSETDPDVYYCATYKEVYKLSVDGTQETIATLKLGFFYRNCKYTVNHGLKIKYEPDFIIAEYGPLATITILPPSEAEKLQAVQKELIGDSEHAKVVSEIDGRFLLSAAMHSKNEYFFTKHGIDIDELKKDLFELFK